MINAGVAATTLAATFKDWFIQNQNPYPTDSSIFEAFAPVAIDGRPAPQPLLLRGLMSESTSNPMAWLSTSNSKPFLFIMSFTGGRAGTTDQDKYGLNGDIDASGQLPNVFKMPQNFFHQASGNTNVVCVEAAGMQAAWAADPTLQVLPPNAVGDVGTVELACRKTVPIPHEFVADLLEDHHNGRLSWRRIWNEIVVVSILPDPQKTADYRFFIEYCQVASTQRTQPGPPAVTVGPATNVFYDVAAVPQHVRDQARLKAQAFSSFSNYRISQIETAHHRKKAVENAKSTARQFPIDSSRRFLFTLI